jgi:hypothetical protein
MTSGKALRRRSRRARATAVAAALAGVILAGCAHRDDLTEREYLDERTAATVTVGRPLVLACDRSDLGVNARDYVTLVGVDVNRAGQHATYVVGYAWSTLDKRGVDEGDVDYTLVADDRVLALEPMSGSFQSLGMAEPPFPAPSRDAVPLAAPATAEALQYFVENDSVRVVRTRGGLVDRFARWRVRDDR